MRIDIHAHFIPPELVEDARRAAAPDGLQVIRQDGQELMAHRQGYRYPLAPEFYNVEAKLKQMDEMGLDISVWSVAPPLFLYWLEPARAADFCRAVNESLARLAPTAGGRLFGVAAVPLQDPKLAASELEYAVTRLGLKGVIIGTTVEQRRLEEPELEPFFVTAEELRVPIMVHPYYVGTRPGLEDYYLTNLIGNPLETYVAATRLILSGFLDRFPRLNVVLVHAGGYLPYQIGRLDHGFRVRPETRRRIGQLPSSYLRRFHLDTITHAALPLRFLVDLIGSDRVVLGTDLPFDMADTIFDTYLEASGLEPDAREAIEGGNAIELFRLGQ